MRFPIFALERNQTLHENNVRINLTESGVHACRLAELMTPSEQAALAELPLGYGHTDGTPRLRQAIADWYPGAAPENVLVAHGSSEANLLALTALLSPGDEIAVVTPNFLQLDGLARALGITVINVALSAGHGWQPEPERIAAALTPRTRLVTLCDPNNPTGVLMSAGARQALAAMCDQHGVWLHVDEIYRGAEIDGGPSPTAWGLAPRVIVSGGLSKSFACPGLRLGWLIAPPEIVRACHERQDYTTIGTGTLAQAIGAHVLQPALRERVLARGRGILSRGRDTVTAWVRERNGWSLVRPDSGGMAFLSYEAGPPSEDLVASLREEESVFVCAGAWFGLDGHIRIGIGVEHDHLVEGLAAIDRFMARRA
ncbi:MAG: pyridoxal phosphate-dependent aminotransferase [Novosphingobium sp.]|jgi:aspartate/methionine/tyrosine aminotransferase|uniref:pyridoxal phosphate-dependent aminotransferase n=1 Tax=Novosphingobium sp. TaxID=1874826 RepID=UPI0022C3BFFD|nr:pyridoxal phosphate-dependent aminotransferase [Novosphingobium sp.]MCZ8036512.1 pyridoxal phosphate-dependent aminotransferase [Novosphingobium sp.]